MYVIGLISKTEQKIMEDRGWEFEPAPQELIDPEAKYDSEEMKMVWVDATLFDVMNGPDWQKQEKTDADG